MDKKPAPWIYGVLGYPAKHSLSPLMHNAAFKARHINAVYQIFEQKEEGLESFLKSLSAGNIRGLNVTIPYKEKVIPFLATVSKDAQLIGAVNTIKVNNAGLEGFNTDAGGFIKHLTGQLKFDPQGKSIAVLGAGGAARAVTVALAPAKPKAISVYDIDKAKLSALIAHLKANFNGIEFKEAGSVEALGIPRADLLVNATPIGMKETDPVIVDAKLFHEDLLVYDLIYNPPQTKLLKLAKDKGARVSCGLGMLLYQGVLSFEIWTGQKAPVEIMQEALRGRSG